MGSLQIREATAKDISLIHDLAHRIWPDTYIPIIGREQVEYMLNMMYSQPSLKKQMSGGATFLLAEEENVPVGFASFEALQAGVYKLQKLYVLPSRQGKGTGRQIIEHIISLVKSLGAKVLELQVNRNNKARFFYQKLGFTIAREIKLDIGSGFFMDDYVMEKKLV